MSFRTEEEVKYGCKKVLHLHDDTRVNSHVGTVWQDRSSEKWSAFCTASPKLWGPLGSKFTSQEEATKSIEEKVKLEVV